MNTTATGSKNGDKATDTGLVRTLKSIVVDPEKSSFIDQAIVKKRYCHALSNSELSDKLHKVQYSIGVTSPNRGEGKTLAAANLAVSFALAYKKKTVLVDMNMTNPCLHQIFGTKLHPGLVESFKNGSIFLSRTKVDRLYLLPAGRYDNYNFGLESIIPVRDILYSLEQEFDIIIVDMNSVLPIDDFPAVFVNELDGLMVVIDTQKTKYADVEMMFKHVKKDQTLGFVLNNVYE
jgi:Mrp family chromosome partitioning ATPase